jgi:hypothetical protein
MQEEKKIGKFYYYVFAVMIVSFLGLRAIDFLHKNGAVEIGGQKFQVEIMKSAAELEKGLSGRASLDADKGMLFVFSKADRYVFWMKDMRFPIDILWINDGKIADIKHNAPVPASENLDKYLPDAPADYVLEINAGLSEKYGFRPGDAVKLDI